MDLLFDEPQPAGANGRTAPAKGLRSGSIQSGGTQERSFGRWAAPVAASEEICAAT
jgi:hypothetical protein